MAANRHIAIYGGAFDPPHLGHQFTLLYLLSFTNHDEIWLLPASDHPFGKNMVPFDHRFEMCRLLAAPFGNKVNVSTVERDGDTDGRTYNTLKYLQTKYPDCRFSLVVGSDNIKESHRWYKWEEICRMVDLLVIGREGSILVPQTITLPNISSTLVRSMLASRQDPINLVPQNIIDYIRKNNLYLGNF